MAPRTRAAPSQQQRGKSTPPKTPSGLQQKRLMDLKTSSRSKAALQIRQAVRMNSIDHQQTHHDRSMSSGNVSKSAQQSRIQEINKILTNFSKTLQNLSMNNSDLSSLNKLLKECKDIVSHFPRFSSVQNEQRSEFFAKWNELTHQTIEKIEKKDDSGKPHTYETAAKQLHEAKVNLEKVQQKFANNNNNNNNIQSNGALSQTTTSTTATAQILEGIFNEFDNIETNIRDLNSLVKNSQQQQQQKLQQNQNQNQPPIDSKTLQENINGIQTSLRKLQSAVPTTKCNQDIGRVILELNAIQTTEKSKQTAKRSIRHADKLLNDIIKTDDKTSLSSSKSNNRSTDDFASHISKATSRVSKKRSKSTGSAFEKQSVISSSRRSVGTSKMSSSSNRRSSIDIDKKTSEIRNNYVTLDRGLTTLRSKIVQAQKNNDALQAQLDELSASHSLKRTKLQNQISLRIRKLVNSDNNKNNHNNEYNSNDNNNDNNDNLADEKNAQFEMFGRMEEGIAQERQLSRKLRKMLDVLDSDEYRDTSDEASWLAGRIRELEVNAEHNADELKRAEGVLSSLRKGLEEGSMDVNLDNIALSKETDEIKAEITKKKKNIDGWIKSWSNDTGSYISLNSNDEKANTEEMKVLQKKVQVDHSNLVKWSSKIENQLEKLRTEAELVKSSEPKEDKLEDLRALTVRWQSLRNRKKRDQQIRHNTNNNENDDDDEGELEIAEQIRMNQIEIAHLEALNVSEQKSENVTVEEQRTQNRQMIDWTGELVGQIRDAMNSQNALNAQLMSDNQQQQQQLNKAIQKLAEANFTRSQSRTEYVDNETQMQQLYTILFDEQTEDKFMNLFPDVKERVLLLLEYKRYSELLQYSPETQSD